METSETYKCELCSKECKNLRSLEAHLRTSHDIRNDKGIEEYYNKYLKKEDDGICVVCGKPTKQHRFGYKKTCCTSCSRKISRKNRKTTYCPYDIYFYPVIKRGLRCHITQKDIKRELYLLKKNEGRLNTTPNKNKCVLYFQQDNFYKTEKKMFSEDKVLRQALIENRMKYLFKNANELTEDELLRGFKIGRFHTSYSHFNPLWLKYFIQQNNLTYIADPFGGWGHHMIGAAAANCKYIYNDLSHSTVEGVRKMNSFFKFNYEIIEGDARDFKIPEECDGVFMCPPYYNIEIYECGKFESKEDYNDLMYKALDNWKNSNAKVLGVIIKESFEYLFEGMEWTSKEIVNDTIDHITKKSSGEKVCEYLYTFKK